MSKTTKPALPAAILKLVKRSETHPKKDKNDKPVRDEKTKVILTETKQVDCKPEQVFDYSVNGNTLTVITTDAQKIRVELDNKQLESLTDKSSGDAE